MLGHLERRAFRGCLGRLGERRGDTQLCRIKGQGAAAYREGQRSQARARNKSNQTVSRETKGRAGWIGAPQSYCVLHAYGSTQREMRPNPENASRCAAAVAL